MKRDTIFHKKIFILLNSTKVHIYTLDAVHSNGYNIFRIIRRQEIFEYMTAQETAEKWNVSPRWVQRLYKENRIDGVMSVGRVCLIPRTMQKPADGRTKGVKKSAD